MPKVHRATEQQMAKDAQVLSYARRKAPFGGSPVHGFDASAIDRAGLTGAPHQHRGVALEMPGNITDQILAAVVPRRRDRLGHEKDFSHS